MTISAEPTSFHSDSRPTARESRLAKRLRWERVERESPPSPVRITVLASFTVKPLVAYLGVALHDAGLTPEVHLGPYDQIVAECLNPESDTARRAADVLVVWPELGRASTRAGTDAQDLMEVARVALQAAARSGSLLVFVLPHISSERPAALGDAQNPSGVYARASAAREQVRSFLGGRPKVLLFDAEETLRRLGTEGALDRRLDLVARIPFTEALFELAGTGIARLIQIWRSGTRSVLAIEPNGLLWEGDANSDQVSDLYIGEEQLALQAFLRELSLEGVHLLAWSSVDRERLRAALGHPEMRLELADFLSIETRTAPWIDAWPELSQRLALAPSQTTVVLGHCEQPQLQGLSEPSRSASLPLALVLPSAAEAWADYLQTHAELDQLTARKLTVPAGASAEPEAQGLEEFLAKLELEVSIESASAASFERVVHLTETVSEFNLTGEVLTRHDWSTGPAQGRTYWTVRVSDRFGSYGMAGALITRLEGEVLVVDGLWLNCRILGKGVEARVLRHLAGLAHERQATSVCFRCQETARNRRAREFVARVAAGSAPDAQGQSNVSVERLQASLQAVEAPARPVGEADHVSAASESAGASTSSALRQFVADRWRWLSASARAARVQRLQASSSALSILEQVQAKNRRERPTVEAPYVAPRTETESTVARIFAQVLNLERVGVLDNFFVLGGQSILATTLVLELQRAFDVELPVRVFFENPTTAMVAQTLDALRRTSGTDELYETAASAFRYITSVSLPGEVTLDPEIQALPPVGEARSPQDVFLTGATGFLGAFLLDELLRKSSATVHCLVRAADAADARARLRANLAKYHLPTELLTTRVRVVVGDLGQPKFGLSAAEFAQLAETADSILHAGAVTNFIDPYAKVKAANVVGTHEVIRLAATARAKPIHFVSTLYVFSPINHAGGDAITEEQMPQPNEVLHMGYTQSKWVAEHLLKAAESRGVKATIYRCGRISGHSSTGACQTNDFLWRMIKASIQLNAVFDNEMALDMIPVDYVSRAIVHLLTQPEKSQGIYHLQSPERFTMSDLLTWIRGFGYEVQSLGYQEFRNRLLAFAKSSQESSVAAMLTFFPQRIADFRIHVETDCGRAQAALEGSGITCPVIREPLFHRYLQYFVAGEFLSAPPAKARSVSSPVATCG